MIKTYSLMGVLVGTGRLAPVNLELRPVKLLHSTSLTNYRTDTAWFGIGSIHVTVRYKAKVPWGDIEPPTSTATQPEGYIDGSVVSVIDTTVGKQTEMKSRRSEAQTLSLSMLFYITYPLLLLVVIASSLIPTNPVSPWPAREFVV
uniref:Uncharacterized protein n=1 Tax=Anopheles coluzzii TaxID=1518534 RepID=A0A8W7P0B6_ANOCL